MEMALETGELAYGDVDRASRPAVRLDSNARVPLYHQIFLILRNRVYGGMLAPGDLMPSEQEVCAEFGVSRITARRALNELAEAGLVVRERGRGTRVVKRPPAPAVSASIEGWLENMSLMGISTEARVLEFGYMPANDEIAAALDIAPGTEVQRAERVRILRGEPMSFLVTYVPAGIGRQYDREELNSRPLLQLLERAGVEVASARQTISATLADDFVASVLDVRPGTALIEVRRVVRDADDVPVEYIRVLYRPDLYRYEMTMRRVRSDGGMAWTTHSSSPSPSADAGKEGKLGEHEKG
jgi:GntR family transcriptional regulator